MAIKLLNKSKLNEKLENVKEEIRILILLDHPNILKYYETYEDSDNIYLIMEYVDGVGLFEKQTGQPNQVFTENQAKTYIENVLAVLNHMHAQGIVHRDIKPENIMITK